MSELGKALLAFQGDMPKIVKDSRNPHFGNEFASLEACMDAIMPKLNAAGIVVLQSPCITSDGSGALQTVLLHAESGDTYESVMLLNAAKLDPQAQGSAITYARRYAILSTLGLVADADDDGNAAKAAPKSAGDSSSPLGSPTKTPAEQLTHRAMEAQYAREHPSGAPEDDGKPENIIITFGKHKGTALGNLPHGYLEWLTQKFEPKNAEQNRIIAGARTLLGLDPFGGPTPDDDIPFAPTVF